MIPSWFSSSDLIASISLAFRPSDSTNFTVPREWRMRITTFSPSWAGSVETRRSMGCPFTATRARPSCGRSRSAMSSDDMILMREMSGSPAWRGIFITWRSTPAVRYRIDGVLRQGMKIPRQAGLPLISRIKIMSSLDIADRLRPQDGRARVAVNGQPIDLRVSTLPAQLGEKVVIRILDSRATVKSLDSLGLNTSEIEGIKRLLENHEGIILVTGPTGSGKTTTLYSCINLIKSEGVNIVTVEDPVEYRMQGIVQVQE